MLRLDTTTRKLQAALAGAVTANQLPITVCYSDKTATAYTGGTTVINTNSATAVDICAAPAASTIRDIDTINIQNADTAAATITIRYNDNGATYTLFKAVLAVGDQLTYVHGDGWKVCDANGALKNLASDVVTLTGTQTLTNKTLTSPDINGGTIDGAVIGGTTAAAGSFTTLSASGAVSNAAGAVGTPSLTATGDLDTGFWFPAANTVAVSTGGVERLRIDGSGLITGATSTVVEYEHLISNTNTNTGAFCGFNFSNDGASTGAARIGALGTAWVAGGGQECYVQDGAYVEAGSNLSGGLSIISSHASGELRFYTGGKATANTRLRINSAGNIQQGTAVADTWSAFSAYQIEATGAFISDSGTLKTEFLHNAYYDGAWKYANTGYASRISLDNTGMFVHQAASGTADTAATFTQTLSLGVGKTLALEGATFQTGTGLTFPATQSACSNANTLDDYEEGTFTPVLKDAAAGNAATAATTVGRYTKVGNRVHYHIAFIDITTTGMTAGNQLYITGMPYASQSTGYNRSVAHAVGAAITPTSGSFSASVTENSTYATVFNNTTTGITLFTVSQLTSGSADLYFTGSYETP